jgi:hypothetical protein
MGGAVFFSFLNQDYTEEDEEDEFDVFFCISFRGAIQQMGKHC